MGILKVLFIIFPIICASEDCENFMCGNNGIVIRFPFQKEGEQHPYCGYPGFNLSCTDGSNTVLELPYSGEFFVRNINYMTQQIQLYDPSSCLPKRLLSLNLSGSPFLAIFHRNYTFLSCPSQNTASQFTPIHCLSNSTNSVSAIPSASLGDSVPESCSVISIISVPLARPGQYQENSGDDFSEDLGLVWNSPDCRDCESQEGRCGFVSRNSDQIGCFPDYISGKSQDGHGFFRIITLSIVGPAVLCILGMACFACWTDSRRGITPRIVAAQNSSPATLIIPQPAIVMTGLDDSTIESYQKLVLGESRRVPGPNDGSCSICLSEYNTKETIRCIPECKHCFHADCIDKWLRMNSTCPLCRNPPSPSPLHTASGNV